MKITMTDLLLGIAALTSDGENAEYDRACVEITALVLGVDTEDDTRTAIDVLLRQLKGDPVCPRSECGYGECSGRWVNGACETHANNEGRCQAHQKGDPA